MGGAREPVPRSGREVCNGGVLIEREHVLGRLAALLDEAVAGAGRLVFLTGEAGIGKTSVVAALTDVAGGPATAWRRLRSVPSSTPSRSSPTCWRAGPWARSADAVPPAAQPARGHPDAAGHR